MTEFASLQEIQPVDGCGITPLAYRVGHFYLCWNLAPDLNVGGAVEVNQPGDISINIVFRRGLPEPINVIVFGMFNNTVEICDDQDVKVNW
jgi:hypothetical protein